jgi:hypothetical protein
VHRSLLAFVLTCTACSPQSASRPASPPRPDVTSRDATGPRTIPPTVATSRAASPDGQVAAPSAPTDQALAELSQMLTDCHDDPTPNVQLLAGERLDYSVASLRAIERFLDRQHPDQLTDEQYLKLALRTGAYLGEVIRRNAAARPWHWIEFAEASKKNAQIAALGRSIGTSAILWDTKATFYFPVGKVMKYLANGHEDSLTFFAQVVLADPSGDPSAP